MRYSHSRRQQNYDQRLCDLVRTTGDPEILAELGILRSTALGWLHMDCQPVVTANVLDMDHIRLWAEVLKLRQRNRALARVDRVMAKRATSCPAGGPAPDTRWGALAAA